MTHKQKKMFNTIATIIFIILSVIFDSSTFAFIALWFALSYYRLDIADTVVDRLVDLLLDKLTKWPTMKK